VFARVGATEKRQVRHRRRAGAHHRDGRHAGKVYDPPEFTHEGTKPPSMDEIQVEARHSGALAKEIFLSGSTQRSRPGTVARGHQISKSGDDRPGHSGVLIACQVGGRGEFVHDGDQRRRELAALTVVPAAPVRERLDPAQPIATSACRPAKRGRHDSQGRELSATLIAVVDELASAADLAPRIRTPECPGRSSPDLEIWWPRATVPGRGTAASSR